MSSRTRGKRSARRWAYRAKVRKYTHQALDAIGYRSGYDRTVDHIVPVSYGFNHDIDPRLIGSRENLKLNVPLNENIGKGTRITPEAQDLLDKWEARHAK